MDGYSTTGLLLLFTALIWTGRDLNKARRPKKGLHDKEIRHVTLLARIRNAAAILMICMFSVFMFAYSGMSRAVTASAEYEIRDNIGDFTAGAGLTFLMFTIVLSILNRKASRHLSSSVRRDAIRTRIQNLTSKKPTHH